MQNVVDENSKDDQYKTEKKVSRANEKKSMRQRKIGSKKVHSHGVLWKKMEICTLIGIVSKSWEGPAKTAENIVKMRLLWPQICQYQMKTTADAKRSRISQDRREAYFTATPFTQKLANPDQTCLKRVHVSAMRVDFLLCSSVQFFRRLLFTSWESTVSFSWNHCRIVLNECVWMYASALSADSNISAQNVSKNRFLYVKKCWNHCRRPP